jgi:predicted NAD/FAD-binding protein
VLPDVRTGTPVTSVKSLGAQGPVQLAAADGTAEYDAVVLATHSDISLKILGEEGPQVGFPHAAYLKFVQP